MAIIFLLTKLKPTTTTALVKNTSTAQSFYIILFNCQIRRKPDFAKFLAIPP